MCRYVSRKDCRKNVVYISRQYYVPEKLRAAFRCGDFNWIAGRAPPHEKLQCKVPPALKTIRFFLEF